MHILNTKLSFKSQKWQQYLRTGTLWQLRHQPLLSCQLQLREKSYELTRQRETNTINLYQTDFELLISIINTAQDHMSN